MTEALLQQLSIIRDAIFLGVLLFGVLLVTAGSLRRK